MWLSIFDVDIYNFMMDSFKLISVLNRTGTFPIMMNLQIHQKVLDSSDIRYNPLWKSAKYRHYSFIIHKSFLHVLIIKGNNIKRSTRFLVVTI